MKKFTKLFLSCAAVTAVTAAVATSAMAADVTGDLAGTYDETTGKLTLTTAVSETATVLVLAPGADEAAVADTDILYIDQTADGTFGEMGLMGAPTADGIYKVKVGYYDETETFKILNGSFSLGVVGQDIKVGDGNLDGKINTADSVLLARHLAQFTEGIGSIGTAYASVADGSDVTVGDGNLDGKINTADSVLVARYLAQFTEGIGSIGTDVTVVEK